MSGQDGSTGKHITSLYNHIKVTPKVQNNHYSELPEIELNGSPVTTVLENK